MFSRAFSQLSQQYLHVLLLFNSNRVFCVSDARLYSISVVFNIFLSRYFTCVPQGSRLDQLKRRRHTVTAALADI